MRDGLFSGSPSVQLCLPLNAAPFSSWIPRAELAVYFKSQEVSEGETIYDEGDVPAGFFVVMEGEVEICLSGIVICRRMPGQVKMSLLGGGGGKRGR